MTFQISSKPRSPRLTQTLAPIPEYKKLLMMQKAKSQTYRPSILAKRKLSDLDQQMERYDRGILLESPKRVKIVAVEKEDVNTDIPILDLDLFIETDPSWTDFKKAVIETSKGSFGPLDELALEGDGLTQPSFPEAMKAANAMKLRLLWTQPTESATYNHIRSSSLETAVPTTTKVTSGDIPSASQGLSAPPKPVTPLKTVASGARGSATAETSPSTTATSPSTAITSPSTARTSPSSTTITSEHISTTPTTSTKTSTTTTSVIAAEVTTITTTIITTITSHAPDTSSVQDDTFNTSNLASDAAHDVPSASEDKSVASDGANNDSNGRLNALGGNLNAVPNASSPPNDASSPRPYDDSSNLPTGASGSSHDGASSPQHEASTPADLGASSPRDDDASSLPAAVAQVPGYSTSSPSQEEQVLTQEASSPHLPPPSHANIDIFEDTRAAFSHIHQREDDSSSSDSSDDDSDAQAHPKRSGPRTARPVTPFAPTRLFVPQISGHGATPQVESPSLGHGDSSRAHDDASSPQLVAQISEHDRSSPAHDSASTSQFAAQSSEHGRSSPAQDVGSSPQPGAQNSEHGASSPARFATPSDRASSPLFCPRSPRHSSSSVNYPSSGLNYSNFRYGGPNPSNGASAPPNSPINVEAETSSPPIEVEQDETEEDQTEEDEIELDEIELEQIRRLAIRCTACSVLLHSSQTHTLVTCGHVLCFDCLIRAASNGCSKEGCKAKTSNHSDHSDHDSDSTLSEVHASPARQEDLEGLADYESEPEQSNPELPHEVDNGQRSDPASADDLESLPDYESEPEQQEDSENLQRPSSNEGAQIMTESSGSEADESELAGTAEEGSSQSDGDEIREMSPAITGGPQFIDNRPRGPQWVPNVRVDEMERLPSCIQGGRCPDHFHLNPQGAFCPGRQGRVYETVEQGMDVPTSDLTPSGSNQASNDVAITGGRHHHDIENGGYVNADQQIDDEIDLLVAGGRRSVIREVDEYDENPGSHQAYDYDGVAITGGGYQDSEAGDAEEASTMEDRHIGSSSQRQTECYAERHPGYHLKRRSGAADIIDARRNRASSNTQLAVDALTRSASIYPGGAPSNETAGASSYYAATHEAGASRDDPVDGTFPQPSRKRKYEDGNDERPLSSIPTLIAQTTPHHTHAAKRARLQGVALKEHVAVYDEPHGGADWTLNGQRQHQMLNSDLIKENIDETMTTQRSVEAWVRPNELQLPGANVSFRHGEPRVEAWEENPVREEVERQHDLRQGENWNGGGRGHQHMPR